MPKKITILSKLLEEEKLLKIAQEVDQSEGEVDKLTADKMADQIFEQLFNASVKDALKE